MKNIDMNNTLPGPLVTWNKKLENQHPASISIQTLQQCQRCSGFTIYFSILSEVESWQHILHSQNPGFQGNAKHGKKHTHTHRMKNKQGSNIYKHNQSKLIWKTNQQIGIPLLCFFHLLQSLHHFLKGGNFHWPTAAQLSRYFSSNLPGKHQPLIPNL